MVELKGLGMMALAVPKAAAALTWRDVASGLIVLLLSVGAFFAKDIPVMSRDLAVMDLRVKNIEKMIHDMKQDDANKRAERNQDIQNLWEAVRERR